MAKLPGQALDGNEAEERQSWIEAGSYNVMIINSNGKQQDNGIYRIGLQLQVQDGEKARQTFWLGFNYLNPKSAQNQDISQNQLKLIAKSCGIGLFEETEALHDKPFNISVKVSESNGYTNNDMTSARAYVMPGGAGATGAKTGASSAPKTPGAPAKGKGDGKPWQKKG